ncbi:hypothetical protein BMS3Abin10_02433 [bacterium BMS3Abin10]|nr:hypothetical protein BMS3Abin10_02433 [bacterium BMS3Abin10]GBE38932.1 hypothetical protein BMS3Bbin08_01549 [bacterium BMS3Bbin08]
MSPIHSVILRNKVIFQQINKLKYVRYTEGGFTG